MTKTAITTAEIAPGMTVQYKKVGKVTLIRKGTDNGHSTTWWAVPVSGPKKFLGVESYFPFSNADTEVIVYS